MSLINEKKEELSRMVIELQEICEIIQYFSFIVEEIESQRGKLIDPNIMTDFAELSEMTYAHLSFSSETLPPQGDSSNVCLLTYVCWWKTNINFLIHF